jgi:hypothetical protein
MPVGTYKVMIAPPAGTKTEDATQHTADELFDHPELMDEPAGKALYPRKYADTKTSGLSFPIVEGDNHFDIDLKSNAGPKTAGAKT